MYLFSVIIPHYNSVLSLKRLIDSIPVDPSVQLIIVDDKSSEDLSEVETLVKARSGIFLHNTTDKKGAGTCRNLGLSQATGKWLVFADADDYFLTGAFDIMMRHIDSEADIIHFIPTSIDLRTGKVSNRHTWCEKLVRRYLADSTVEENGMMLRYRYMVPWSKMIRNKMVQDAGIRFDEVMVSNDIMFSAKCGYCAKKIDAFAEKIYCVTRADGTLTTRHDEGLCRIRAIVFKEKYTFLAERVNFKKYGCVKPMEIRFLCNVFRQGYRLKFVCELHHLFRQAKIPLVNPAYIIYAFRHLIKEKGIYNQ